MLHTLESVPHPPQALPERAEEGDSFTVAHDLGGVRRQWEYVYLSGAWRLRTYVVHTDRL